MNQVVYCIGAEVLPRAALGQGVPHAPHLCAPTSWRLCEADACSSGLQKQRKQRRARHLRWSTAALATTYALAVAVWFSTETPLLLLAVLPLPAVVDALTEDAR